MRWSDWHLRTFDLVEAAFSRPKQDLQMFVGQANADDKLPQRCFRQQWTAIVLRANANRGVAEDGMGNHLADARWCALQDSTPLAASVSETRLKTARGSARTE
jgi:hypothetical protein